MNEENILMQIGLGEEQALIYQALLDKGPQKAKDLASWTGIKRSSAYKVLQELEAMGIIEKKGGSGAVSVFFPNHPGKLLKRLEEKQKDLETSKELLNNYLGSLVSKFNLIHDKPNIQFFEGKSGIQKVLDDTLNVPHGKEIYTYTDLEAIIKYIPEINTTYSEQREKLGIRKKGLLLDTIESRKIIKNYHTDTTETKFINYGAKEFQTIMQIYENKISYLNFKNDSMIGVIIEDPSIYKMHKAIFEHLWSITPNP